MTTKLKVLRWAASAIFLVVIAAAINNVSGKNDLSVSIHNRSAFTLTDVELTGDENRTQQVPAIPSGGRITVDITHAFCKPGVGIRFLANGTEVSTGPVLRLRQDLPMKKVGLAKKAGLGAWADDALSVYEGQYVRAAIYQGL